jgi:hypothetical protein
MLQMVAIQLSLMNSGVNKGASIVGIIGENGYSSWLRNSAKFDWSNWQELNAIRSYNIDDCESTLELVAWLRTQQKEALLRLCLTHKRKYHYYLKR